MNKTLPALPGKASALAPGAFEIGYAAHDGALHLPAAARPAAGGGRADGDGGGGPVIRLLPHHRYVCTRHRYWIGPPDAG